MVTVSISSNQCYFSASINMTKEKINVRFVSFRGETIAVFMGRDAGRRWDGTQWLRGCYAHIGQHGECYDGMKNRKRATRGEYLPLLDEMARIGYDVRNVDTK